MKPAMIVNVFWAFCLAAASQPGAANAQNIVFVDRKNKSMSIVDRAGITLTSCPIGIGRGPLRSKLNMQDCITPVGKFTVDVVLSDDAKFNSIDETLKASISKSARLAPFVKDGKGLGEVFQTMNRQDFNHDGKPDHAYGCAFIGLDGRATGPKLIEAGRSARWYSIALHGTADEAKAIGSATSEGCIHVRQNVLKRILRERLITVGSPVFISDAEKVRLDVKGKTPNKYTKGNTESF